MELLGKRLLIKLQKKNQGNAKLGKAIDDLIKVIEHASWSTQTDVLKARPDADCIHSDGFYFFDINVHRSMILIEFSEEEAIVVWVGTHDEYDRTFKGNKKTIERWLRNNGLIA